jgi:hypothetical protein
MHFIRFHPIYYLLNNFFAYLSLSLLHAEQACVKSALLLMCSLKMLMMMMIAQ